MHMLPLFFVFCEFQAPPIGLEYELRRVEPFTMDPFGRKYSWNDAKEDGGKKIVLVHVDMAWVCWNPAASVFLTCTAVK